MAEVAQPVNNPPNLYFIVHSKLEVLVANGFVLLFILMFIFLFSVQLSAATSANLGLGRYSGDETVGNVLSLDLGHEDNFISPGEPGWISSVRVSRSQEPNSNATSLSLDQGLGDGYSLGLTVSKTIGVADEEKDIKGFNSNRYAGRFGFWLRKNTLRIGIEGSQQKTTKEARDFQDTDGLRIRTAEDATGSTATVRFTHLTTPTLILLGNVSQTSVSARPVAFSYGGEVRAFVPKVKAAFHLGLDSYADRGDVDTNTDYGKVSAFTKTFRYHQRIPGDLIFSSVTRFHQEKEVPRSEESESISKFHWGQMLSLKWRYITGAWTDDASDVGVFGGFLSRHENSEPEFTGEFIRIYGIQFRLVI